MAGVATFRALPAARIEKADKRGVASLARRLAGALSRVFTDEQWQQVARAIDAGRLHDVEPALLGVEGVDDAAWGDALVDALGGGYEDAANEELRRLGSTLQIALYQKAKKKPRTNRFTGVPHNDAFIRSRSADLVVRVSREQRRAIREAILARYTREKRPETLVRDLKRTVGLDPRRARALRNYEDELRSRGARNVDMQVDRYGAKLLQNRAETIARTESTQVENAARIEAWTIADDAGDLPDTAEMEWVSSGEPCPECQLMDGQRVTVGSTFSSARYGAVAQPPLHPNCYCVVVLRSGL